MSIPKLNAAWRGALLLPALLAFREPMAHRRATIDASAQRLADTADVRLAVPRPSGRFGVGRASFAWIDSSRADPAGAVPVGRLVTGWLWYPAPARAAGPRRPVLPGPWGEARAAARVPRFGTAAAERLRLLEGHAQVDAPAAAPSGASSGAWPVIVFAPGNGGLATDYAALLEELASHGFVVVGVAPVGLSDVVEAPDGRMIPKTLGAGAAIGADQQHLHADLRFVVQRLRALQGSAFGRRDLPLDVGRMALVGHSVGGAAAFMAASQLPGLRTAVNLDGDPMAAVLEARPRVPLLLLSSEVPPPSEVVSGNDSVEFARVSAGLQRSEARRTADFARIASCARWSARVRIAGTRHLSFADGVLLADGDLPPGQHTRLFGSLAGVSVIDHVRPLLVAFLRRTMLGADDRPDDGAALTQEIERVVGPRPAMRIERAATVACATASPSGAVN